MRRSFIAVQRNSHHTALDENKKRDLRRKFRANKKGQVRSLLEVNEELARRGWCEIYPQGTLFQGTLFLFGEEKLKLTIGKQ